MPYALRTEIQEDLYCNHHALIFSASGIFQLHYDVISQFQKMQCHVDDF